MEAEPVGETPANDSAGPDAGTTLRVVADIAPIHSLVQQVLGKSATVQRLIQPGSSPHDYALRPSDAAALQSADLVISTSNDLTPWLPGVLQSLAPNATAVQLMTVPGTRVWPIRQGWRFDVPAPDDVDDVSVHPEHDHGVSGLDPHAWLDPRNAQRWLEYMATLLGKHDPEHAAFYRRNARQAQARIERVLVQLKGRLTPLADEPFIVSHDAFQYFERYTGLLAEGALSASDAQRPGPARLKGVQSLIRSRGIRCLFSEPQFNVSLASSLFSDGSVRVQTLDPLGARIAPGVDFYAQLLDDIGHGMSNCLGRDAS